MRLAYIFILFVFFTGCVRVGPNFRVPHANIQESWSEESSPAIEMSDYLNDKWWINFNDATLNTLVDFALRQNYTLEAAVDRIIAARAVLGIAIGEFFPQTQQAEGAAIRNHISANAPNTLGIDRDFWDNILGFRIAWELDFWGRYYRGYQAAIGEFAATKDDYFNVQRLVISDLVFAYIELKTVQKRIQALEHNIKIQYRSVEIAKVRWQKGMESELDYAQAVTLWKETVAQKVNLEIDLKRFATTIAVLIGLTYEEFICQFTIDNSYLHVPKEATINCPASLITQRPDLRRSLDLLYAQSARIGIAESDLYPRISFTGFLGLEMGSDTHLTANQSGKHFFSRESLTFFYGPDFRWPILNYGRLTNKVKQQYAILHEGIALYRNQVLEAYKEVEDALTFYVKSIEETENLVDSFNHAKRAVDISILQYREGIADYTRVLNSLQLQVTVEDELAQSEGNIGLSYAAIYKALGVFLVDSYESECE